MHNSVFKGYSGVNRTLNTIRDRLYWVIERQYVDNCKKCSACSPFEKTGVDIVGPFSASEQESIFVLVTLDAFTNCSEAYATPNQATWTVATIIVENMFTRFGVLLELHTGTSFD